MGDKRKRLLKVNIDRRVKNLYNWITKVHKIQSKQPKFKSLDRIFRESRGGKYVRKRYRKRKKYIMDQNAIQEYGYCQGVEDGKRDGIEIGKNDGIQFEKK